MDLWAIGVVAVLLLAVIGLALWARRVPKQPVRPEGAPGEREWRDQIIATLRRENARLLRELAQAQEYVQRAREEPVLGQAAITRLALLVEELGEAQQAAAKVLQHGWMWNHRGDMRWVARVALESEIGHVLAAVAALDEAGDLRMGQIMRHRGSKRQKMLTQAAAASAVPAVHGENGAGQ